MQEKPQHRKHEETSPEPDPSQDKGKGRDLWNWGNTGIQPEELNVNQQKAMLDTYKRAKEEPRNILRNLRMKQKI